LKKTKNNLLYLQLDFILITIKIIGGLLGNCKTLLADGIFNTINFIKNEINIYYQDKKTDKTKGLLEIIIGLIFISLSIYFIKNLFSIILSIPSTYTIIAATIPFIINLITKRMKLIDIIFYILTLIAILAPYSSSVVLKYADIYSAIMISMIIILTSLKMIKNASNEITTQKEKK